MLPCLARPRARRRTRAAKTGGPADAGSGNTWDISGTSAATLTPRPDLTGFGSIYHPDGPVYDLSYVHDGRTYGGLVAQGSFQAPEFSVPVPVSTAGTAVPGIFTSNSNGRFDLTATGFTASINVGMGHLNAEWTATGRLVPSVAAFEPGLLLVGAAGLAGALALRRR